MKTEEMRRRGVGKPGARSWGAILPIVLAAFLFSSCSSGGAGTQAENDDQVASEPQVSDSKRLKRAVRSGGIEEVRRVFAEIDKDINSIHDEGDISPLAWAILREDIEVVEFFLAEGVDVNGPSESPAIVTAAFMDNIVLVKLLLERGADPNSKTEKHGDFALMRTSSTGIAKMLIDAGANIDAQFGGGHTALHVAAALLNLPMVSLLVSEGANIEAMDNDGQTALDYAAKVSAFDEASAESQESIIDLLNQGLQ